MASIYDLKPRFQTLLRPMVKGLAERGVSANAVTTAAMLLSLGVGFLIAAAPAARWPLGLLPIALFVRMALNAIDGMLAREHGQASRLGALLNELGDVVSDAGLYLPLALVPSFPARWIVAFVVLAGLTETAGIAAEKIGASRRYDGPLGKSDRAFLVGFLALLVALGVEPGAWSTWIWIAATVLSGLTVWNRCRRALGEVGGQS